MNDVGVSGTRRAMLAGAATGIAGAFAGCAENLWSRAENPGPEQVSLTIKAVPADDDLLAATIASQLRENFEAAGIDATFEPLAKAELYREILLEGEYDVFVTRHSGLDEYDDLRGLLHSRYVSEQGWQNPFHFSDVTVDDLLEAQFTSDGIARERSLSDLFDHLTETVPYTVVAYPHRIGGSRATLSLTEPPRRAIDYLEILSREHDGGSRDRPLEVGIFGEQLTNRLNPIVVDRNRIDGLLGLIYEPLVRRVDDEHVPWLADDVRWESTDRLTATVTLREDPSWHDGESLDVDDVLLTHRLIRDTSLGETESPVPAPRYRCWQSLTETVNRIDDRTIEFSFRTVNRESAVRALRIPILPEHIWEPRSSVVGDRRTEALVVDNEEPIGSGPFVVDDVTEDTEVTLVPFDDHAFFDGATDRPSVLEEFPQFEGIRFQIAPNAGALVELLTDEEIDLTGSPVPAGETEPILEEPALSAISVPTNEFYMVGYNAQEPELGNPYFRRILSKLVDREHAAAELFEGYADPAETRGSLFGFTDTDLADDETELTAFPGSAGEVDPDEARSLFEAENYQYEDGTLIE